MSESGREYPGWSDDPFDDGRSWDGSSRNGPARHGALGNSSLGDRVLGDGRSGDVDRVDLGGAVSGRRPAGRRANRSDDPAGFSLRHPSEVIEAVPFLLGFHPRESLVIVGLDYPSGPGPSGRYPSGGPAPVRRVVDTGGSRRIGVVARIDLSDTVRPGVLAHVLSAVVRADTTGVIALAFRDDTAGLAADVAAAVTEAVETAGVDLVDLLIVGPQDWLSALCEDPAHCTDAGGHRDGRVPSPTAVSATVAGMVARPDRSDVVDLLAPEPGRDAQLPALEAETARRAESGPREAERRRRSDIRAVFAAGRVLPVLDDARLVRFGSALMDRGVLDACWLAMEDGRLDGEGLWRELGRRLPSPYDAPALFLAGWTQWRRGNGTLAGVAAEQALASDPAFTPAELLMTALSSGLDPFRTPRVRRGA